MPVITYTIQWSVKTVRGKMCWYNEYEHILVDVSDEVAAFLEEDDKREQRYLWKIKKQKQDAGIHTVLSLDEIIKSDDGVNADIPISDIIEDTVNPSNYNPLEIVMARYFPILEGIVYLTNKYKKHMPVRIITEPAFCYALKIFKGIKMHNTS